MQRTFVLLALLLAACSVVRADALDLWSVANSGTFITDSDHDLRDWRGQIVGFNQICPLINMFGGAQGCGSSHPDEDNNALFGDYSTMTLGTAYNWVSWQTDTPVKIASFYVKGRTDPDFSSSECPPNFLAPNAYCWPRSFSQISLFYQDPSTGNWTLMGGGDIAPPNYDPADWGNPPSPPSYFEILSGPVYMPVAATDFKAEFTLAPYSSGDWPGVRILDLEGFGSVPEPLPALSLALVVAFLAIRTRFRLPSAG